MSTYNSTGEVTQKPLGDIPLYARVKRVVGGVEVAGAADKTFGSALRQGFAQSTEPGLQDIEPEKISVKICSAPGTHFAIANGTIPEGSQIEGAANGRVALLGGGTAIGFVEETGGATAAGQVIEVVYYNNGS